MKHDQDAEKWIILLILKQFVVLVVLAMIWSSSLTSVANIDPNKHEGIYGTTYPKESLIVIGAKGLLDGRKKDVEGTLAHEICHIVMRLIFNNSCKPYVNDEGKRMKFDCVVMDCESEKLEEKIISLVFDEDLKHWHAELIVRIPQLLVIHKENKEKVAEIQEKFATLFEYYEIDVLAVVNRELSNLEMKFKVNEFNDVFDVLEMLKNCDFATKNNDLSFDLTAENEIEFVESNCVLLTMKMIHENYKKSE